MKEIRVIDPQSRAVLTDLARKESRSLLQYVRDAFPWTTAEEHAGLEWLQRVIQEEEEATASVVRFLYKHRVPPPYIGPYPISFTTINFISLDHLIPLLVEHERRALADLERQAGLVADAEARTLVQRTLEM